MNPPITSPAAIAARLTDAAARAAVSFGERPVEAMSDDALLQLLADASEAKNALEVMLASASAEVSRRSARELGYRGLAQRQGHRTGSSLVQNITGQSTGDVRRAVQVGEDLLPGRVPGSGAAAPARVDATWLTLLRDALATGRLGQAQFQAIRSGLGEPPVERYPDLDPEFLPDAWAVAVERLVNEAVVVPVEALRAAARVARDRLDPVGVTLRFEERFAARSFRTWIDEHGQHHGRFVFDDDAALWVHTILSAALRPRRGPRFVPRDGAADSDDAGADAVGAVAPEADDRSNDQLQYDTLLAILRTGANADPTQAFGDRQPGVRIVVEAAAITSAAEGAATRVTGVGHGEDLGAALPGGVVETYLCDAGASTLTVDATGRPLDLGREQRLFSRTQRIAIAIRDGGCIWPSCTAPPSWCEYHHIDHWAEHRGKTNVDDGVPLCRNCHMRLHNQGWRITRARDPETGADTYWLHPPPRDAGAGVIARCRTGAGPTRLETKSPRRFRTA